MPSFPILKVLNGCHKDKGIIRLDLNLKFCFIKQCHYHVGLQLRYVVQYVYFGEVCLPKKEKTSHGCCRQL